MEKFIRLELRPTLCHASATDVNSFVLSFMHLEQTLSQCFTMKVMQSGWSKAGLIGLELHKIMSHWIGWKDMSADQVQGIKDLLPPYFHETATSGILSDASMQAMQPFFDVDFHHYAVDRSHLTTSRTRSQHMTVFQRVHRQKIIDALVVRVNAPEVEVRPDPPFKVDGKGLAVCQCGGRFSLLRSLYFPRSRFGRRHYVNDDANWAKHVTYKKHTDWLLVQQGRSDELAVAAHAFRPAHEHEWFCQDSTLFLKQFAQYAQLSFSVVKYFCKNHIRDSDLTWLACKCSLQLFYVTSHL
jgi:hypothetical protein